MELAELALLGEPNGGLEVGHAPPLRAGLKDAAGLLHHVVQGLAERDGQAARLLAVDVFAGLGREDRRRRMPAVAGGDQHGVDIAPREQRRGSRDRRRSPRSRNACR